MGTIPLPALAIRPPLAAHRAGKRWDRDLSVAIRMIVEKTGPVAACFLDADDFFRAVRGLRPQLPIDVPGDPGPPPLPPERTQQA
jgi:hypothetical protein